MAASNPGVDCPIRKKLCSHFQRCYDHYNQTLCALLEVTSVEGATLLAENLFDECAAAKKALHRHERKHGCYKPPI